MDFKIEGYRSTALGIYGEKCEWIGCGWDQGSCDVHHIDYQEQQLMERKMREAYDNEDTRKLNELQAEAMIKGWGVYSPDTRQLHKNDVGTNLAVLCPNHHRYLHTEDLGIQVLKFIPKRKARV